MNSGIKYGSETYNISGWEEWLTCARNNRTSDSTITFTSPTRSGKSAACSKNGYHYIGFNPPIELLVSYIGDLVAKTDIKDLAGRPANKKNDLGPTMRLVRRSNLLWAFNYGMEDAKPPTVVNGKILIGKKGPCWPNCVETRRTAMTSVYDVGYRQRRELEAGDDNETIEI